MHHPMLTTAIKAAREAGKAILRFVDRPDRIQVQQKNLNDFVTQVDQFAEQTIIDVIYQMYPSHAILAEESGQHENAPGENEYQWIIDPLDGTTNFIHGFPHFAVSIALKHHNKLELGVIYDPLRNELFTASRGGGAQLNNRKLRVSTCSKLNEALLGTGFPVRRHADLKNYLKIFEALFPQTSGMRRAGAAALDLAYVAAGRLDGFWEANLAPWDIAAGALLVIEAGGFIGDFAGKDQFLESGNVIAGNPKIYAAMQEVISSAC